MDIKTIWTDETTVSSTQNDFMERWKLSAFFEAMQEAATNHAAHLGYGYQDMMERDLLWILSRVKIRIHALPKLKEKITVQTWPKGIQQKLFFMRDHKMTGSDGRQIASATTAYVLINMSARRILPSHALPFTVPDNDGLSAIAEPLEKIPPAAGLCEMFTTQARYSAVDLVGHVNNARYIDWISDCFSFEEHRSRKLRWLQINYINEVKPGEGVTLYRAQYPGDTDAWYLTGTNQNTGLKAFEAALEWEQVWGA